MLDPDSTNVLHRRIMASIVDLGLITLGTALVWRTQWITFTIDVPRDPLTDVPLWEPVRQLQINKIAESLHTSFEWGGKLVVLDQTGLVLTALFGIVLALIAIVLLPANTGWSPGKRLMGLTLVDSEGNRPGLIANLVRSIVGIVDAIPFFVPGLAGWLLARSDDFHRRLGDRVAKTTVIDARIGPKFIDAGVYARRNELRRAVASPDHDNDSMVPIEDRLFPGIDSSAPGEDQTDLDEVVLIDEPPSIGSAAPDTTRDPSRFAPPQPLPLPLPLPLPQPLPSGSAVQPGSAFDFPPPAIAQPPLFSVSQLASDDTEPLQQIPRPTHRAQPDPLPVDVLASVATVQPGPPPEPEAIDPDDSDASEEGTDASEEGTDASGKGTDVSGKATDVSGDATDVDWERPVPEPAPVWAPDRPLRNESYAGQRNFFAPLSSAPDSTGARSTSAVTTVEHHTVEHHTAEHHTAEHHTAEGNTAEGNDLDPDNGTVWNHEWKAWLFWDPRSERWLRHDTDTDRWVPIS